MEELHAVHHPHDALFRAVFGEPENTGELLRSTLPADITSAIEWRTLRHIEGSFVDEALRGQQADLLFAANLAGRPVLIYLLLEHKADEDPFTALQLLRYVVAIWERHRREHPEQRRLPPVLPLVLHHGKRPWHGPCDLRSLLELEGLPESLAARQPAFWFALDDLTAHDEPALHARRLSIRVLLPLLHLQALRRTTDTVALLISWRSLYRALLVAPGGRAIAHRLVSYVAAVSNEEAERLRLAYRDVDPGMENDYMTTAEQLMQRGEVRMLLNLLEQRFGPLPDAAIQRVRSSTTEELGRIARAILTAATLDEVIAC